MSHSKQNSKEKLPLVGIGPKLLISMCPFFVLFGIVSSIFFPIFQIPINYYLLVCIGVILIILGLYVFIYSERILTYAHGSTELITSKTFAFVRHPMYASWGLGTLPGIFFLFNSWILFFLLIIYYVLVRVFLRGEEKYLSEKFGKKYEHYKKHVNAFFPKLKKYKPE
jgi:protein-S-isoprenylcysteine O-methyltransferase Ste14